MMFPVSRPPFSSRWAMRCATAEVLPAEPSMIATLPKVRDHPVNAYDDRPPRRALKRISDPRELKNK
jgi:hypothetical protein